MWRQTGALTWKMSEQKTPSLLRKAILWAQRPTRGGRKVKGNSAAGHWTIAGRELWDDLFSLPLWKARCQSSSGRFHREKVSWKYLESKGYYLAERAGRPIPVKQLHPRRSAQQWGRAVCLLAPSRPVVWTGRLAGLKHQGKAAPLLYLLLLCHPFL